MDSEFVFKGFTSEILAGSVKWEAPSNIALIKYWGKKENQIPANPSISFTLSNCKTTTTLSYKKKTTGNNEFQFDLFFEGQKKESFKPKITTFFERIVPYVSFIKDYEFVIETSNSFPHSSGIASSASGMSVLALCIMDMEKQLNPSLSQEAFYKKASFLARLGSGSACRSIEGPVVSWGSHKDIVSGSNLYGSKYDKELHPIFENYQDTILLIDKGEKKVSSTIGHNLMHNHPYAENRFQQAHDNLSKMGDILESGDLDSFIKIVESEALTLHAMMMTSMPYFILMKPNTLKVIEKIWEFREASGLHLCFTLDAGANVHLLYPNNEKEAIMEFITKELVGYCQNAHYICDRIGSGAQKL